MVRSVLVALALVLLVPAAAHAGHVPPTVTMQSTLGKPDRAHVVKDVLTWNAACGDPSEEIAIGVSRVVAVKGRSRPVVLPTEWVEDARPGAGTFTMRMLPGSRWKHRVEVRCRHADGAEEDGATAVGEPPAFHYLPPVLEGWEYSEGELCGFPPGRGGKTLQARMWAEVELEALYDEDALLRKDDGAVLVVRGAGVRTRRMKLSGRGVGRFDAPEKFLKFEMPVFKRAGRARVQLELDGDRSNTITIPVARLPRGCEGFAAKGA